MKVFRETIQDKFQRVTGSLFMKPFRVLYNIYCIVIDTVHSNTIYPWFLSKTKPRLVILTPSPFSLLKPGSHVWSKCKSNTPRFTRVIVLAFVLASPVACAGCEHWRGGVYIRAVRRVHLGRSRGMPSMENFWNLGLRNGIIPAFWQHFWAKSKGHKLCVFPLVSNTK